MKEETGGRYGKVVAPRAVELKLGLKWEPKMKNQLRESGSVKAIALVEPACTVSIEVGLTGHPGFCIVRGEYGIDRAGGVNLELATAARKTREDEQLSGLQIVLNGISRCRALYARKAPRERMTAYVRELKENRSFIPFVPPSSRGINGPFRPGIIRKAVELSLGNLRTAGEICVENITMKSDSGGYSQLLIHGKGWERSEFGAIFTTYWYWGREGVCWQNQEQAVLGGRWGGVR
ncbi:hypothetical protein B0H16DRAFT_1469430 [Mycena metata]|uniref:Uncharacterized protein n=1 Tax=Mycena metata TaxID=1033252 RepID=A0AAD7HZC5_9AGAR|nr:hypothetical protein B0H16DRAFT_1469430 [Mycena metata]